MSCEPLKKVITSIRRRELVVFAGAGVSIAKPTALLGFLDFQNEMLRALHSQLPSKLARFYHNVYVDIKNKETSKDLSKRVANVPPEFVFDLCRKGLVCTVENRPHFELEPILLFEDATPNGNHYAMAELLLKGSVPTILTTNYDTLIEKAEDGLVRNGIAKRTIRKRLRLEDFSSANASELSLIKLHGCISDPSSIVTSFADVGRRAAQQKYNCLRKTLEQNVVLFTGYRGADIDIFSYLATTKCKGIVWNARSKASIIGKIHTFLNRNESWILEMDLCEMFEQVRARLGLPRSPKLKEVLVEEKAGRDRFNEWAARAARESVELILGDFWEYIGEWHTALEFYDECRRNAARARNLVSEIVAQSRKAGLHYRQGKLEESWKTCQVCLEASKRLPNALKLYEYVNTLQLMALIESRRDPKNSIKYFNRVQEYQNRLEEISPDQRYRRAELLLNAANCLTKIGFSDQAAVFFGGALTIFDEFGDIHSRARVLAGLANIAFSKGHVAEAISLYRDAEYLFRETSDVFDLPRIYLNLGISYRDIDDYTKASEYAAKALDSFALLQDTEGQQKANRLKQDITRNLN